jgi:glycyl-tRNA synthetase
MEYFDQEANERYLPYVIEPSLGATRMALAFLIDAYDEEELSDGDIRTVLHLHPALAPVKCAVLPLSKKLGEEAGKLYEDLRKHFNTDYDESGAIGRRYRRQDEIGTPFCVTCDFDSQTDGCVTVRERDSMAQERVPITEVAGYIKERLIF